MATSISIIKEKENKAFNEGISSTTKEILPNRKKSEINRKSSTDFNKYRGNNSENQSKAYNDGITTKLKAQNSEQIQNFSSNHNAKDKHPTKENIFGSKLFICNNLYPDIKECLIKRGWKENTDQTSTKFNFLWTLKLTEMPSKLTKNQIVNHFINNTEISKKSGLTKNIKNLIFKNIDVDNFYPRCYELSERNDMEDFIEDFKTTKAVSFLKRFLKEYSDNNTDDNQKTQSTITEEKLETSIEICQRKLILLETISTSLPLYPDKLNIVDIKSLIGENEIKLITDKEWAIIGEEDMKSYIKEIENLERMNKINTDVKSFRKSKSTQGQFKLFQTIKKDLTKKYTTNSGENKIERFVPIVESILVRLKKAMPQFFISGEKNIWILKPSALSRGRGITCMNNLSEILHFLKSNSSLYMAQKYIENPMIILGRKFDIRQWILVTDLDPLTIWMYDTPYLRFGAEDYKLEEFSNLYSHLTNNSVVKYSMNFENNKIQGNMWEIESFAEYLKMRYGSDVWKEVIQEKIKKIVISSMESVKKSIKCRKNSYELFGYDIMIDEQLNAWLIEVNSSPAMDYSTVIKIY
jgi:tubulin monoglycylase TTLL3/8